MRIALVADTHLSARSPECLANWHAARRAVERVRADLTVHLGDITLDGQTHPDELVLASRLMQHWPTEVRCVPGNHDLGDGSGEVPLDRPCRAAYASLFGPGHWAARFGNWTLFGIDAQLLGSGSDEEAQQWHWLDEQAGRLDAQSRSALFLHRPLVRPLPGERHRRGRYACAIASERLLRGPLAPTLRLVVSGHTHQYLDQRIDGVRHVWMPSSAFILPDDLQTRIGEKLVGIGLLELDDEAEVRFDLMCPDGMFRHDVTSLKFFRAPRDEPPPHALPWAVAHPGRPGALPTIETPNHG